MRWTEYIIFLAIVAALALPVGLYLARVSQRRRTFLDPLLRPVESILYRWLGVRPEQEMTAGVYIACFLVFGVGCAILLYLVLILQRLLPGGPADAYLATPMTQDLAINTAVSFTTTTTWQAYAGETTLRYLAQVIGLVSQNFLAGAAGLAAGFAFIRGVARERSATIGNFWVDLIRSLLYVLLPLALLGSLFLLWQGVPLNMAPYTLAHTMEGKTQIIAQGPVAALEFIKNLGTNGGGFFNANGAHPYANPTPLTNFIGMLAIAVLPASLMIAFGEIVHRPRAGWVLLMVMMALFLVGLSVCDWAESAPPPQLAGLHIAGGNMEGKEVRFGPGESVLTAVVTSNTSTGSYNSMHDSFQPLGVLVPLMFMLLGEVVFGGLGAGVYGMVIVALVGVFLGGLMIGRTPEYLGKKITSAETRLIALYALITPKAVLALTAFAVATSAGRAGLVTNTGPHAFTEILFAYASSMATNGQNMAGLNVNSVFYNLTTVVAMLVGRYGLAAIALALAGRFAVQRRVPMTAGTLPSDTPTFGVLVFGTILLVGALCFLPALALGPIVEFFQQH
ncbi:MAG TPA: potassium-transporting ATPase subunit KdpA [Bryobacteraceae bacterium]|nr:potassium-transporting ATPase subunit KdpA [Bryobacteraceae bacterium]